MITLSSVENLQENIAEARAAKKKIVFVPTMGALHEGHLSLVKLATDIPNSFVILSIFVNPTQFGKNEDFDKYPRTLQQDVELLNSLTSAPAVLFLPQADEVYPGGIPEQLAPRAGAAGAVFEGVSRPGHFDGVLAVVSWFFRVIQPDTAVFGAKDAQQLFLIRRMIQREFDGAIEIIEGPTIREESGLAKSSRNRFLSDLAMVTAPLIFANLKLVEVEIQQGAKPSEALEQARNALDSLSLAKLDYLALVDKGSFKPVSDIFTGQALLIVALNLAGVRLIDNLEITIQEPA